MLADFEDLADATTEGNYPLVAAVCLPIGGYDRGGREVPAVGHVVVDEILKQELVDVLPVIISGKGPEVAYQAADYPGAFDR